MNNALRLSSILGLLTALSASVPALAQTVFSFRTATSTVTEPAPAKDSKVHIVQVQASVVPTATVQVTVTDLLTGDASAAMDYSLNPNPLTLTFGPGLQQIQTVALEIKGDQKVEQAETIDLSLSVPAGQGLGLISKHTITLSDPDEDTPPLPAIRIATGSNFDYQNSVELKNLFFGVEIFAPDAFRPNGKRWFLTGFNLGFAWSQNFSADTAGFIPGPINSRLMDPNLNPSNLPILYRQEKLLSRINADSALIQGIYYTRATTTRINNFNFFASHLGRFWRSEDNALDVFFSIRLEGIRRNFEFDYAYTPFDTLIYRARRPSDLLLSSDITKQTKGRAAYYDFYLSAGFPFRWEPKSDLIELRVNPMLGYGWFSSPFHYDAEKKKFDRLFYLVQLSIIEKKFGIRLGGEVRGSFSAGRLAPYYTVTLSKVFTFKKFEEYLTLK